MRDIDLLGRSVGLIAALLGTAALAQDQDVSTLGLEVQAEFRDASGKLVDPVEAGQQLRLSVQFLNASTGVARTGLAPSGWLRQARAGNPACGEAARAFRATGALSPGDISLSGLSILSLGEDHSLAVIDPQKNLASSNIAAVHQLGSEPGSILVHHGRGEVLVSRPEQGDVLAIATPLGKPRSLATGLDRPGALLEAPGGRTWLAENGRGAALLLGPRGDALAETAIGSGPIVLRAIDKDRVAAVAQNGSAALLERFSGKMIRRIQSGGIRLPVAATRDSLLSRGSGSGIEVRDHDSPETPRTVTTRFAPAGLEVDASGVWAVAWSGQEIDLVSLPFAKLLRGLTADDEVHEAVFAGGALFITYARRPVVTVIDLATLTADGDAAIRDIRLAEGPGKANLTPRRLVSLEPAGAVATVRPGSSTLFTVMAGGGIAMAPMSALAIRSAMPVGIAVQRRGMIEAEPGRYESIARLPTGGSWELVVTTGVGGTTSCFPIVVAGLEAREAPQRTLRLVGSILSAKRPGPLMVKLEGAAQPRQRLRLVIASLDGGWSEILDAPHSGDDVYRATAAFPWQGRYSIAVTDGSARPLVVEVQP